MNICTLPHDGPQGGVPAVANICERVPKAGRWPNGGGGGVRGGSTSVPGWSQKKLPQHLSGVLPTWQSSTQQGSGEVFHT